MDKVNQRALTREAVSKATQLRMERLERELQQYCNTIDGRYDVILTWHIFLSRKKPHDNGKQ